MVFRLDRMSVGVLIWTLTDIQSTGTQCIDTLSTFSPAKSVSPAVGAQALSVYTLVIY